MERGRESEAGRQADRHLWWWFKEPSRINTCKAFESSIWTAKTMAPLLLVVGDSVSLSGLWDHNTVGRSVALMQHDDAWQASISTKPSWAELSTSMLAVWLAGWLVKWLGRARLRWVAPTHTHTHISGHVRKLTISMKHDRAARVVQEHLHRNSSLAYHSTFMWQMIVWERARSLVRSLLFVLISGPEWRTEEF